MKTETNEKVSHSPLPWRFDPKCGYGQLFDANGIEIGNEIETEQANIDYMLRAANNYEPMRKALEEIIALAGLDSTSSRIVEVARAALEGKP